MPPDQVIWTGSPMREVLDYYRPGIEASRVLDELDLTPDGYYLVSAHREENVDSDEKLRKLFVILNYLATTRDGAVVVSTHPRTRKRIEALGLVADPRVTFCKPFGFLDYIHLQMHARAVLSDSGTITEESSILNFPALNLREVHERPEGFEEASVILCGLELPQIAQGLDILASQPRSEQQRLLRLVDDYSPTNVSDKIVRILLSYTPFVNERVWHKSR